MPAKSQHGGKKRSSRSKKGRSFAGSSARGVQLQAVVQTDKPVSLPEVSPIAAPPVARYPYIVAEMQRIGILMGIILAILVVLYFVLHHFLLQ